MMELHGMTVCGDGWLEIPDQQPIQLLGLKAAAEVPGPVPETKFEVSAAAGEPSNNSSPQGFGGHPWGV